MDHPAAGRSHQDPYRVLGVDASASRHEIARAYRRAVQRAHPDAQPADPQAAARFRELTEAYDLLTDPARRAAYDRTHRAAAGSGSQPPPPRYPGATSRPPGLPHPFLPPHGRLIVAGPVRIEPPAAPAGRQGPAGPPGAEVEDPPVILGTWPSRRWRRPW
jgi:curved DNA-binding protein CbpA